LHLAREGLPVQGDQRFFEAENEVV